MTLSEADDFFDHAPCGCIVADKDGRILRVNRILAGWLGPSASSCEGRPFSSLLKVGGRIYFETHVAPLLRMHGKVEAIALELACEGGRSLPVLVNASEQHHDDGSVLRFVLINASERHLFEQHLRLSRDAARAAVDEERSVAELRDQFIAVLGHDLRNPVASIASGINLLSKEDVTERGRKVLTLMSGSVVRATALIENVMDLARAGLGGGIGLEVDHAVNIAPTIEQVVAEMRSIAPDRSIHSTIAIDHPIHADAGRIGQLVSNLLGNALTHGAAGQPILIEAKTAADLFTVAVSNGGIPIDPATMEGLFKPFFRGSVRPSQQGLGLGLHITSEIAKAHGGRVEVASDDRLTTFTFSMPRARASASQ